MKFYWDVIIASWKLYPIPRQDDLKYSQPWQFLLVSQETFWLWNVICIYIYVKMYEAVLAHVKFSVVHWIAEGVSAIKYWVITPAFDLKRGSSVVLAAFSKMSVFRAKENSESNLEFDPSHDTWSRITIWKCCLYKGVGYPNFQQQPLIPLHKLNFCFLKTFLGKWLIHQFRKFSDNISCIFERQELWR